MLTQYQTTEPQAALLAACPRPRALALVLPVPSVFAPVAPVATAASASWATAPIAALPLGSERRQGSVAGFDGSGVNGNGVSGSGTGVEGTDGKGYARIAMAGPNQQDKQYKQHLTARREPVTWRPPR